MKMCTAQMVVRAFIPFIPFCLCVLHSPNYICEHRGDPLLHCAVSPYTRAAPFFATITVPSSDVEA